MMDKVVANIDWTYNSNKNTARQRVAKVTFCDIYIICVFLKRFVKFLLYKHESLILWNQLLTEKAEVSHTLKEVNK